MEFVFQGKSKNTQKKKILASHRTTAPSANTDPLLEPLACEGTEWLCPNSESACLEVRNLRLLTQIIKHGSNK